MGGLSLVCLEIKEYLLMVLWVQRLHKVIELIESVFEGNTWAIMMIDG